MDGTTKKTDALTEMGLVTTPEEELLALQTEIRADLEWALAAGKGRFLVGLWAIREARECPPEQLPRDVKMPRDAKKLIVQRRLHAYFPYGDFPIVIEQLKAFLSSLLKSRHVNEIKALETADSATTPSLPAPKEQGENPNGS